MSLLDEVCPDTWSLVRTRRAQKPSQISRRKISVSRSLSFLLLPPGKNHRVLQGPQVRAEARKRESRPNSRWPAGDAIDEHRAPRPDARANFPRASHGTSSCIASFRRARPGRFKAKRLSASALADGASVALCLAEPPMDFSMHAMILFVFRSILVIRRTAAVRCWFPPAQHWRMHSGSEARRQGARTRQGPPPAGSLYLNRRPNPAISPVRSLWPPNGPPASVPEAPEPAVAPNATPAAHGPAAPVRSCGSRDARCGWPPGEPTRLRHLSRRHCGRPCRLRTRFDKPSSSMRASVNIHPRSLRSTAVGVLSSRAFG